MTKGRMSAQKAADEHIGAGDALYLAGRYSDARVRFAEALRLQPHRADAQFKVAVCDWADGRRDAAFRNLQAAVRLDDRLACAHDWLSQWYLQEGMGGEALTHINKAFDLAANDSSIAASRAIVLEAAGELDAAWELLLRLLKAEYIPPRVAALYARLASRHGEAQEALALVNRLLAEPLNGRKAANLHFVAAELLDGLGRYDEAFAQAERANRLRSPGFDPAAHERLVDRIIAYFTRERLTRLARATFVSDTPVFIVGMPRSGTSLVEQILASHPNVHGAGELDFINRIGAGLLDMLKAGHEQFPDCLDRLTMDQADGLAQVYLQPLQAMSPGATRITDKMPLNFMQLGLIAMLFPKARIIHCRREPMDTCLSCFMTNFTAGHEFCSDLKHLGSFYCQYERLMAYWKNVIDLPILDVAYEQVVANYEDQVRRMLEFLGLEWDDRCLRFHETRRFVMTSSVEQVRRPVYQSSVHRWKNYERHLAPLRAALGLSD